MVLGDFQRAVEHLLCEGQVLVGDVGEQGEADHIGERREVEPFAHRELDHLDRLPETPTLDAALVERAKRYAYHFFVRRMIALDFMTPTGGWPPYRPEIEGLSALLPGTNKGLDVICDGILRGGTFVG